MYLLVYAIRWARQHQQENLRIYYELTRLVRGGNKTYFISLGLPRFSNPRLQLQQGNIRVLCPHCGNLTPQQCLQIQQLRDEWQPPPSPPELEPPLFLDKDNNVIINDVNGIIIIINDVIDKEAVMEVEEEEEQVRNQMAYQNTQNELTSLKKHFNKG